MPQSSRMVLPMGWRVWDAYERDREAQRRALAWRVRYNSSAIAVFALIVALPIGFLGARVASGNPVDPAEISVIDGDTIRVHHEQPNVRLVGFNAPETRRAACDMERELGGRATRRLRDLV